jgi:hypothetical protein
LFSDFYSNLLARSDALLPIVLLGIGFTLRMVYAFYGPLLNDQMWSDMKIYAYISDEIERGIWRETHFFQSIGYPLLITLLRKIIIPAALFLTVLQAACSCLTLFMMYKLTLASLGKKVALISLGVGALHLPWILYSNFALPETIFTSLLSVCAWLSFLIVTTAKPKLLNLSGFGLFFMMAFWLKGTHALWAPMFLGSLLIFQRKKSLIPILVIGSVMAAGLAAHGLLSHKKIGKIQLSASAGGLNFIEGKCPSKSNTDNLGYNWLSPLYYQLGLRQHKQWDRPFTESGYYLKEGLKCIQENPFVLLQSLESIPYLFYGNLMWPFNQKSVAPYTRLHELFFALFAVVGFCTFLSTERNIRTLIIWLVPIASIFLTVYIFKSEIRYRVPFDIWFIPVAVKGWLGIIKAK